MNKGQISTKLATFLLRTGNNLQRQSVSIFLLSDVRRMPPLSLDQVVHTRGTMDATDFCLMTCPLSRA